MNFSIGFKNLPFVPDHRQVIYIENLYDQTINEVIVKNIDMISRRFESRGFEFVYIPFLGSDSNLEARVRYYAPYLTTDIAYEQLPQSSLLLSCMARPENRQEISPSLIIYSHEDENGEKVFDGWNIDNESEQIALHSILALTAKLSHGVSENQIQYSLCRDDDSIDKMACRRSDKPVRSLRLSLCQKRKSEDFLGVEFSLNNEIASSIDSSTSGFGVSKEQVQPYEEDQTLESLLSDLDRTVKRLQLNGLSLAAIRELIDKHETLSRMTITADYHIFLPDYNNLEIKMTTLPKALFFLFLRYPKGLVLKSLPDYYTELYNIYKQLRPKSEDERIRVTITKLVNPYGNAINENIARIRAAFVKNFDEHLAENYFVTGSKGEPYAIRLDRQLIDWLED